jgi:hypothetical protein
MSNDSKTWCVRLDTYDIQYYLEHPEGLAAEMHLYHAVANNGKKTFMIVLRMCFYTDARQIPLAKPEYPPERPDYEHGEDIRIGLHYHVDCLGHILSIVQSPAPLEFVYELVEGKKQCHRLKANTCGWIT